MYLIDYHTHSQLSPDSQAPLELMAQAAVGAGLRELCVTDHYDLLDENGRRTAPYDWAPAIRQFDETAAKMAGHLTMRLGLELGSAQVEPSLSAEIYRESRADFVIGSLHNWSPESAHQGSDFYYTPYRTGADCYAALDDYFDSMEKLAPLSDCYDVLGHVIYPLRYMTEVPQTQFPTLERYHDQLRRIFRTVAEVGRGIEVNTYRGRTVRDWVKVLKLYRDCGGEIITVGSDAHAPESVGKGAKEAYEMLRELGFSHVTIYHRHQPEWIKL